MMAGSRCRANTSGSRVAGVLLERLRLEVGRWEKILLLEEGVSCVEKPYYVNSTQGGTLCLLLFLRNNEKRRGFHLNATLGVSFHSSQLGFWEGLERYCVAATDLFSQLAVSLGTRSTCLENGLQSCVQMKILEIRSYFGEFKELQEIEDLSLFNFHSVFLKQVLARIQNCAESGLACMHVCMCASCRLSELYRFLDLRVSFFSRTTAVPGWGRAVSTLLVGVWVTAEGSAVPSSPRDS